MFPARNVTPVHAHNCAHMKALYIWKVKATTTYSSMKAYDIGIQTTDYRFAKEFLSFLSLLQLITEDSQTWEIQIANNLAKGNFLAEVALSALPVFSEQWIYPTFNGCLKFQYVGLDPARGREPSALMFQYEDFLFAGEKLKGIFILTRRFDTHPT